MTLSDYLAGVKTLAVLPDGKYKQQLLDKLEPVKNQLSNENSSFAAQIQQSDASMAAAEKSYQERQAKALAERTKELNELKKILLRSRRPMIPIRRSSIRSKIAKMMSLLGKNRSQSLVRESPILLDPLAHQAQAPVLQRSIIKMETKRAATLHKVVALLVSSFHLKRPESPQTMRKSAFAFYLQLNKNVVDMRFDRS